MMKKVAIYLAGIGTGGIESCTISQFEFIDKKRVEVDFLDFTTSSILMPLNALFLCIIAGWFLKIKGSRFIQNKFFAVLFDLGLKLVIPVVLLSKLNITPAS